MRKNYLNNLLYLGCTGSLLLLVGCAQTAQNPAPIVSGSGASTRAAPAQVAASAPVVNGAQASAITLEEMPRPLGSVPSSGKTHIVQPGENLYRISLNNGLRHQDVARWNGLDSFDIKVGQVLRLSPPETVPAPVPAAPATSVAAAAAPIVAPVQNAPVAEVNVPSKAYPKALKLPYSENAGKELAARSEGSAPARAVAPVTPAPEVKASAKPATPPASPPSADKPVPPETKVVANGGNWLWPTEGKVVARFSDQNKGIDIAGQMGQAILAAGDGKVVYSGSGLKGYGKLIIIKHDKEFLSAYAHNSELLVKEGQSVKKGQRIANMGNSDADQVKLHFEIREFGKPVNPENHLVKRS